MDTTRRMLRWLTDLRSARKLAKHKRLAKFHLDKADWWAAFRHRLGLKGSPDERRREDRSGR